MTPLRERVELAIGLLLICVPCLVGLVIVLAKTGGAR